MSAPPSMPPVLAPRPRRWLIAVAAVLAVLLVLGGIAGFVFWQKKRLDEREEQLARDAAELTEGSEEDASRTLRDEDYRFALEHPGEGWKLAGPETMLELDIDALAGAFRSDSRGEVRMTVAVSGLGVENCSVR